MVVPVSRGSTHDAVLGRRVSEPMMSQFLSASRAIVVMPRVGLHRRPSVTFLIVP